MIPVTLTIENFLSYTRAQVINFENYKLICLSGKNGHGKSALLDAITWALWGQARKIAASAKPDDGLLNLGKIEMTVSLDFLFNNQIYRVKRSYSKKYGKPHTHIDFGIINKELDRFVALTEKTTKLTQQKIENTLKINYESFINSSFLRQGQSNEFSKKSPKDRKEILTTILGLNHFDIAKKETLNQIRIATTKKEQFLNLKEHLKKEIDKFSDIEIELNSIEIDLKNTQNNNITLIAEENLIRQREENLNNKEKELDQLTISHNHYLNDFNKIKDELIQTNKLWIQTHKEIINLPDQKTINEKYQIEQKKLIELQKQFENQLNIKSKFFELREDMQKIKNEHDKTYKKELESIQYNNLKAKTLYQSTNEDLNKLEKKEENLIKELSLIKINISKCRSELCADTLILEFEEFAKLFEKLKKYYYLWIESGNNTNIELKKIKEKQKAALDTKSPSCPLCDQNLSQARKKFLYKNFTDQEVFLISRFNKLSKAIQKIKSKLGLMNHEKIIFEKLFNLTKDENLKEIEINLISIEKESKKEELKLLLNNLLDSEKSLKTSEDILSKSLIDDEKYKKLNNEIIFLQKEISKFNEIDSQKKLLENNIKKYEIELNELNLLNKTKSIQQERKNNIILICKKAKNLKEKILNLEKNKNDFENLKFLKNELNKEKLFLKEKIAKNHNEKEEKIKIESKLKTQIESCIIAMSESNKYEIEIISLNNDLNDLSNISTAFGKDGIQALILENVIPEIEYEANKLLSKLTDNNSTITIESLKDLKKGGTKETLDINISDSFGIRPYEMFSGGEAFKIDFALRIAISKLLSKRSGTPLQTLIIDEGFGSQDEDSLAKIMDSIYSIQDDFEKIIIVSHLPSMKDQFPVHFNICKNSHGSSISIHEQG